MLSVVLFLPAYNRCANGCTAADEQQGNPQNKVACVTGLGDIVQLVIIAGGAVGHVAGYEHYEISNFARPGKRSRHNSSYWHEIPYIGIGAAAHSYKRNGKAMRSWNVDDISEYISRINQGELPSESETLDLNTRYNDLITTALRTSDGIDIEKTRQEFGKELAGKMMQEAEKHIVRGLMKIEDGRLSLTHQGLYISDDVMSDFMIV